MYYLNNKSLIILAIVSVLVVAGAILLSGSRQPVVENQQTTQAILPELRNHLNDLTSITIIGAEQQTLVSLEYQASGWTVKQKLAYPVDKAKLSTLLLSLADAKPLESKTSNVEHYAELAVEDISSKDAKSVLIKLEGANKTYQLLVGKLSSHGNSTFVRIPNQQQSWLVTGQISVERDPAHWLDSGLTAIAANRIADIQLNQANTPELHLNRSQENAGFQLLAETSSRDVSNDSNVNQLAANLADLSLLDVVSSESMALPEDKQLLKASVISFDGLQLDLVAWQLDSKHYLELKASVNTEFSEKAIQAELAKAKQAELDKQSNATEQTEKTSVANNADTSKPGLVEPEKVRQQRLAALSAEVDSINNRSHGRYFEIPAFKYQNMARALTEIVKKSP